MDVQNKLSQILALTVTSDIPLSVILDYNQSKEDFTLRLKNILDGKSSPEDYLYLYDALRAYGHLEFYLKLLRNLYYLSLTTNS